MKTLANSAAAALLGSTALLSPAANAGEPAHYRNFRDFAVQNGIRTQQPGVLMYNTDHKLLGAIAAQTRTLPPDSIAFNASNDMAVVVVGEQLSERQGLVKYFMFHAGRGTAYSFTGDVTISNGSARIQMRPAEQHEFQSLDERSAVDRLGQNFARRDQEPLRSGPFAAHARAAGLPLGALDSRSDGQFSRQNGAATTIVETTSCMPLSARFGLCATNVYNATTKTYGMRLESLSVDGNGGVMRADAVASRPFRAPEDIENYRYHSTAPRGLQTVKP